MPEIKELSRASGGRSFQPTLGRPLEYDEGFSSRGDIDDEEYEIAGNAAERGIEMGLPKYVKGDPLGCGCSIAYLHGVGQVVDGQLETDYMCDSGWHNFIVFQVREQKKEKEPAVKIDKFGNLVTEEGFTAGELEEY